MKYWQRLFIKQQRQGKREKIKKQIQCVINEDPICESTTEIKAVFFVWIPTINQSFLLNLPLSNTKCYKYFNENSISRKVNGLRHKCSEAGTQLAERDSFVLKVTKESWSSRKCNKSDVN
jgi:hypothetical protein